MPQTSAGKSTLAAFVKEYGAKKGKAYFYAKSVKSSKFAKMAGEMSVHNRAKG
jgi:5-formaminoimidazole-4-carboxamide-1-beta-D-ribofuranosyl 5'-monophosphate synthetase